MSRLRQARAAEAFKKYDKDGDGMINFTELGALMRGLAGSASDWNDAAVKALLTAMDSDNDGKVRWDMADMLGWCRIRRGRGCSS